jgi:hypothetical protein
MHFLERWLIGHKENPATNYANYFAAFSEIHFQFGEFSTNRYLSEDNIYRLILYFQKYKAKIKILNRFHVLMVRYVYQVSLK